MVGNELFILMELRKLETLFKQQQQRICGWLLWVQFLGHLAPEAVQVSLPFTLGFHQMPLFSLFGNIQKANSSRKCFSMKWCGKLPWIWRLRGWGYVSFPKFSPFYTLLFWPRVKAHPLRQGRGSHVGAAPRPSDCDGQSLQTAFSRFRCPGLALLPRTG